MKPHQFVVALLNIIRIIAGKFRIFPLYLAEAWKARLNTAYRHVCIH